MFGRVGIDSIAGPSEVLIIADDSANAAWVAADMLAQAEHNPGSALLVTPSGDLAEAVVKQVEEQLAQLERAAMIRPSLEKYSAVILVRDLDQACDTANRFATEHLQIMTADDEACLQQVRHAGARFFGPLSCNDFLKASSVVRYDAASLAQDAPDVGNFAEREGLTAHARAVKIRGE